MRSRRRDRLTGVVPKPGQFSHEDANAISRWALGREAPHTVVVDLSHVTDATTAAFATLVVLRRRLLRDGRDLRLSGLRERAHYVYAISRLTHVLPQDRQDLVDLMSCPHA